MSDSIVRLIDHAVLKPTHTGRDVVEACAMCAEYHVASICVKPSHVALAATELAASEVGVSTVIGFPHGGTSTAAKVAEAIQACDDGAVELDMVVNLGHVLEGAWNAVADDIQAVVDAARTRGAITKVIFECGLLPDDETKRRLCRICEDARAAFVKTSTGFAMLPDATGQLQPSGATEHDVRLMRAACGEGVGVKASGGIRSYDDAVKFVELGATRLGTSGTAAIAAGERGLPGESY